MRPVLYTDGEKRADLRVSVRVSVTTLECALSSIYADDWDTLPKLTRKEAESKIRDLIGRRGLDGVYYWTDDRTGEEIEMVEKWAKETVKLLFPDFF